MEEEENAVSEGEGSVVTETEDMFSTNVVDRVLNNVMPPAVDTEAKINEFLGI